MGNLQEGTADVQDSHARSDPTTVEPENEVVPEGEADGLPESRGEVNSKHLKDVAAEQANNQRKVCMFELTITKLYVITEFTVDHKWSMGEVVIHMSHGMC